MKLLADDGMGIDKDISTVRAAIPLITTDSATDGGVTATATYTFSKASNTAIFEISADDFSFATGGQAIIASDFNNVIQFTTSQPVFYADAHLRCPETLYIRPSHHGSIDGELSRQATAYTLSRLDFLPRFGLSVSGSPFWWATRLVVSSIPYVF